MHVRCTDGYPALTLPIPREPGRYACVRCGLTMPHAEAYPLEAREPELPASMLGSVLDDCDDTTAWLDLDTWEDLSW